MKVRYIKNHKDEYGMVFPIGCVTDHAEPEALKRIADGLCVAAHPDARLFKAHTANAVEITECAVPEGIADEAEQPEQIFKHKKSK